MRSDREHCASRVAVEQEEEEERRGGEERRGEEERRGGEEEQATDIKSNNPHLAGGEKLLTSWRPEKLLRCYQTLMKHKWETCGLASQLKKQLIRKKGEAWLQAQEKDDDNE